MLLRDVELGDVEPYVRLRCDPTMMAELGRPLPRDGIEAKVERDVRETSMGRAWIKMIVPDAAAPDIVAGSVALWGHEAGGVPVSEIGSMVRPEFQGRGLAKAAVRALLQRARDEDRWGTVHAFPGITNVASNGICRSLRFTFLEQRAVVFADRVLGAT
jgi:RimJ/RimL family protein N-acetyltransferase